MQYLEGKKTYIGGAVIFLAGGLFALGWIDEAVRDALIALGGGIAVVGFRSAMKGK